jgi:hypothetical protein
MKKKNKSMDKEKIMKKTREIRPETQPRGKNVKFGKKLTKNTIDKDRPKASVKASGKKKYGSFDEETPM